MISFERILASEANLTKMDEVGEINIFQTPLWLNFIAETKRAEPVVATVKSEGRPVGYYSGLLVRKYGLRILGSPFRGWGTYFMGFNLLPGVSRVEVVNAFPNFAFRELGCHYFEIVDPNLKAQDRPSLSYKSIDMLPWHALALTKTEDALFANMKHSCRNCIRKSAKCGVTIEEAVDIEFAEEYYAQFADIMKKHGGVPTYEIAYLRKMIQRFLPSGYMLLLRARDPRGRSIATGIFFALNKTAVFWGAASRREYQALRPNEALAWYGIRQMKARGAQELHLGGKADQYKEKFGSYEANLVRIKKAKNPLLEFAFNLASSVRNDHLQNLILRRL